MTIKESLARLPISFSCPISEYIATDAAIAMISRKDIIAKLEQFHLPEITKLICGSEELLTFYSEQYSRVAPFYVNGSSDWIYTILPEDDKDSVFFSTFVFPYASQPILKNFLIAYRRYVDRRNEKGTLLIEYENRKTVLEQKIVQKNSEKEKLEAVIEDTVIRKDEKKLSEIKKKVSSCKGILTKLRKELDACQCNIEEIKNKNNIYSEIISRYISAYNEANSLIQTIDIHLAEARQAAFDTLDENSIIKKYIHIIRNTHKIPEPFSRNLRQITFCQQLLSVLDEQCGSDAISIIAQLYENGCIDIYDDPFSTYLSNNPESVSHFFINEFFPASNKKYTENSDLVGWLGFIIDNAFPGNEPCNQLCHYDEVWENITSIEGWQSVVDTLLERKEILFLNCISKILLRASGIARKQLLILVQRLIDSEIIDSLSSLVGELLENYVPGNDAPIIINYLLEKSENESSKLRRVNERMAFKMNHLSANVFGAVSDAIEALETLASNLDNSSGEVLAAELVASKLKKYIVDLRHGLEVTGVSALENSETWIHKKIINFDADKHTIPIETLPQKVYLRTLGFVYTNSEGNTKTVPAKVGCLKELSPPQNIQQTKKKTSTLKTKKNLSRKKSCNK